MLVVPGQSETVRINGAAILSCQEVSGVDEATTRFFLDDSYEKALAEEQ
jgi:hypothetical protein